MSVFKILVTEAEASCIKDLSVLQPNAKKYHLTFLAMMLDRIGQTFELLSKAFMNRTIPGSKDGQEERSLASMLGEIVWSPLTEIIIKDCLEKCVPKTSSQVQNPAFINALISL